MIVALLIAVSYIIYKVLNFDTNVWSLYVYAGRRSLPPWGGVPVREKTATSQWYQAVSPGILLHKPGLTGLTAQDLTTAPAWGGGAICRPA